MINDGLKNAPRRPISFLMIGQSNMAGRGDISELSENIDRVRWGMGDAPIKMNRLLREVVRELPISALASSDGLSLRSDGIHFSARAARELGIRYHNKYIELTE